MRGSPGSARRSEARLARVEAADPGTVAVSPIVARELWHRACRSRTVAFHLETRPVLVTALPLLDVGREKARQAGPGGFPSGVLSGHPPGRRVSPGSRPS